MDLYGITSNMNFIFSVILDMPMQQYDNMSQKSSWLGQNPVTMMSVSLLFPKSVSRALSNMPTLLLHLYVYVRSCCPSISMGGDVF